MQHEQALQTGLAEWAGTDASRAAVAGTVLAIAQGCASISGFISSGSVWRNGARAPEAAKALDDHASELMLDALRMAPVGLLVTAGTETPLALKPDGLLMVAMQSIDAALNIDKNVSLGTVFSVLPLPEPAPAGQPRLPSGLDQLAAGYVMYGACTTLVLTLGSGTHIYVLDPVTGNFHLSRASVMIPEATRTFAVNASNFRRWDDHVRAYIDDCLSGQEGPHGDNYNMRWSGSLVIECHRIMARGGVFLYPADRRPDYRHGKYHLLYECNPVAFLVEQAGGGATTGHQRLLEQVPGEIHQKSPIIFGSLKEVRLIERYHTGPHPLSERSQLFGKRGLFRT